MSSPKKGSEDNATLTVFINDCDGETADHCTEVARSAFRSFNAGELKHYNDVAQAVHESMGEKFGGSWHTIVGKSYGSFVTHETASTMSFSVGNVYFLCWRHG